MLPRAQYKTLARTRVSDARVSAYGVTLVYFLITVVLDTTNRYISGSYVTELLYYLPELELHLPEWLLLPLQFDTRLTLFYSIMVMLITSVLNVGYALYHLSVRHGRFTPFSTLFDGFSFVGRIVLLQITLTGVLFLGFLLFFVPGVVMTYRYRFAVYNLCENQSLRPLEAMRMSAAQTRGRKWELLVLDLSFFGWNLLSALTLGLLSIWVMPYFYQTDLQYFDACKRLSGVGTFPSEGTGETPPRPEDDPFR